MTETLNKLIAKADSYLSLVLHRHLRPDTPEDLRREIQATVDELRHASALAGIARHHCDVCDLTWSGPYTDCPGCLASGAMKAIGDLQASPSLQEQGWQSIETAPKDDKAVLLLCRNYRDPAVGFWFHDGVRGWWTVNTMPVDPTQWAPIPPLPPPSAK